MNLSAVRVFAAALITVAAFRPAHAGESHTDPVSSNAEDALFRELPVVEAAAMHLQGLRYAPADVTVITESDIRLYGHTTLAEVLASVRGFYVTYDRAYHYAGTRGFNLPGDFGTRIQVMLNGHYLEERIYGGAGHFGQDFGLDLELVKRIEIIRGPSSALYGSSGVLTTINIVTRPPAEQHSTEIGFEGRSFGAKKGRIVSSLDLSRGATLLLSASVFNNTGQDIDVAHETGAGLSRYWVRGADGERGYHTFSNLRWRSWDFTAMVNSREKTMPIPWDGTLANDRETRIWDARNFVEAAWSRQLSIGSSLMWRTSYDWYNYKGTYRTNASGILQENRDVARGDWITTRFAWQRDHGRYGNCTIGSDFSTDIRQVQQNFDVVPRETTYLDIDKPEASAAIFVQDELPLTKRWRALLGVRLDKAHQHSHFISPRAALLFHLSSATNLKFTYGRGFRNASSYENHYEAPDYQIANLDIKPERGDTLEFIFDRQLSKTWSVVASIYHYRMRDLIEFKRLDSGLIQFDNVLSTDAAGTEFEVSRSSKEEWQFNGSLSISNADERGAGRLPNSPTVLSKLRVAVPWRGFWLSGSTRYISSRRTINSTEVPAAAVADVTLVTRPVLGQVQLDLGIRNLFDKRYWDPAALAPGVPSVRSDGRAFFVRMTWHAGT